MGALELACGAALMKYSSSPFACCKIQIFLPQQALPTKTITSLQSVRLILWQHLYNPVKRWSSVHGRYASILFRLAVFTSDVKWCCEIRDVTVIMLAKTRKRKLAYQVYFDVAFFWLHQMYAYCRCCFTLQHWHENGAYTLLINKKWNYHLLINTG